MKVACLIFQDVAVASLRGFIFVMGGLTNVTESSLGEVSNSVYCFDLTTFKWESVPSMVKPRSQFPAVVFNDKIYALGGLKKLSRPSRRSLRHNGDNTSQLTYSLENTLECYDPDTNVWKIESRMPLPLRKHLAAASEDNIYVTGGFDKSFEQNRRLYSYNPESKAWTALEPFPILFSNSTISQGINTYKMKLFNKENF